jgi:hypothetical protein
MEGFLNSGYSIGCVCERNKTTCLIRFKANDRSRPCIAICGWSSDEAGSSMDDEVNVGVEIEPCVDFGVCFFVLVGFGAVSVAVGVLV